MGAGSRRCWPVAGPRRCRIDRIPCTTVARTLLDPEVNAWITVESRTIQPDFMWSGQRVILETDGYATHGTRKAFGEDRRRDQMLTRNGWTPLLVR